MSQHHRTLTACRDAAAISHRISRASVIVPIGSRRAALNLGWSHQPSYCGAERIRSRVAGVRVSFWQKPADTIVVIVSDAESIDPPPSCLRQAGIYGSAPVPCRGRIPACAGMPRM